jgi:hypothetical protein
VEPENTQRHFDPSMPDSHKRKNYDKILSEVENVFTLKVENLTKDIMYVYSCFEYMSNGSINLK